MSVLLCALAVAGLAAGDDSSSRVEVYLHLDDGQGLPFTAASVEDELRMPSSRSDSFWGFERVTWPSKPSVFCAPVREACTTHPRLDYERPFAESEEVVPGSFRFLLDRGYRYLLGLRGGEVPCTTLELDLTIASSTRIESEHHLCLRVPTAAMGELVVTPLAPSGLPELRRVTVRLEDERTGLPLAQQNVGRNRPVTIRVPHGDYMVRCLSTGEASWCGQSPGEGARYGGDLTQLCLASDVNEVSVAMDRGGLLELEITGEPAPEHTVNHIIEVFLHPELGWPFRVGFLHGGSPAPFAWPGTTARSEPIPAGKYCMVARYRDGRTVQNSVELKEGEVTKAQLRFADH